MEFVYVLTDWDDCRNIHVFRQRRHAIQYAYEHCRAFGAYLSVKKWNPSKTRWQYQDLSKVAGDDEAIDYLDSLSDEDVNDVFYEYYFLAEINIESIED